MNGGSGRLVVRSSGRLAAPPWARDDAAIRSSHGRTRPLSSGIYHGWIRHRRVAQVAHGFRYRIFYCFLDLAELPQLFAGQRMWGLERWAPAAFHREDYFGQRGDLATCVRDLVERRTGTRPLGPIRLLTHLRMWGTSFNPVTFYYCFAADGERVEAVVAEITNTPWGERHAYVVAGGRAARFAKAFHVSPFQDMDLEYDWRFTAPGERLGVHMVNRRAGARTFDATLVLRRLPWCDAVLRSLWLRFPHITAVALAAIYLQAARLWLKRAPFFAHPPSRPVTLAA